MFTIKHTDRYWLIAFCQRWKITELSIFGSALRDDFRPDSDIDIMASFDPDVGRGLLDQVEMLSELKAYFGREVDLVNRKAVERSANVIRIRQLLSTAKVLYATV